jgi:hypothetical protein
VSSGLPEYTVPRNGNGDVRHIVGDFGPRELVAMTKAATPQTRSSLGLGADTYEELGRSGLRHWGGFVFEEWLRELQQGRRAAEVYREMQDQDPLIGAVMYAITMLMRRVTWWCEPKGSQQAEWLWGVLSDMRTSWPDTITDITSFLGYGYSWNETVFKKRNGENRDPSLNSRFNDGQIGLAGLPGRSQDSLWKWVFDDTGQTEGMIQNPPPDYLLRFIPREKALHFRTTIFKENPEGRSILRTAYRPWYFARNLQNLEGIGMERDLAGLPMLHPPPGVDIWDANDPAMASMRTLAQNVVSSIRRDEQEGIVLPDGWVLELLSTGGTRQLDISGAISRYENRIATSVLADLVMMGQDKVGSYALAVTKKDLFAASLGAYLDIISSVINTQLIPRLWALNGFTMPQPSLAHGAVETVDLDTLGNYIMRLGQSGAPIDWETVLPWAMNQGGLPEPQEGHDFSPRVVTRPGPDTPASDRLTAK